MKCKSSKKVRFIGLLLCYTGSRDQNAGRSSYLERESYKMEYVIKMVNGHVEVYDCAGNFQFSADTYQEAEHEIRDVLAA